MKNHIKKNRPIMLRVTDSMYKALYDEAQKRECSIPALIRDRCKIFLAKKLP